MQTIILRGFEQRQLAKNLVDLAPDDSVVKISPRNRSTMQNAKLHAMLGDLRDQKPQGRELDNETWKGIFLAEIGKKVKFEPSLDGTGVVALAPRTSTLNVKDFSDLIECIYAYGAEHGVKWTEKGYYYE
jgi:hypothetical protein